MHVYRENILSQQRRIYFANLSQQKQSIQSIYNIPSRSICEPNSEAERPKSAKAASRPAGANENKHSRPKSIFQDKANRCKFSRNP